MVVVVMMKEAVFKDLKTPCLTSSPPSAHALFFVVLIFWHPKQSNLSIHYDIIRVLSILEIVVRFKILNGSRVICRKYVRLPSSVVLQWRACLASCAVPVRFWQ